MSYVFLNYPLPIASTDAKSIVMNTRVAHPDDLFTLGEIERGCGMPARMGMLLGRYGLTPEPVRPGSRGRAALYDLAALGQMAVTGALSGAVGSYAGAARIAKPLAGSFVRVYGGVPCGMADVQRKLAAAGYDISALRVGDYVNDVLVHRAARSAGLAGYRPGHAMANDLQVAVIAVANRRCVFTVAGRALRPDGPEPLLEYLIDEDGEQNPVNTYDEAVIAGTEQEFDTRLRRDFAQAVVALHVNLSLAVRNALDAIYDLRHPQTGGAS